MNPGILYAALGLTLLLLGVMLLSLGLFVFCIRFRSTTIAMLCILKICAVIQTWSLLIAAIETEYANDWMFWGAQVCGLAPWSVIVMLYVLSLYKSQSVKIVGLQVTLMILIAVLFALVPAITSVDRDLWTDIMSVFFVAVACLPPGVMVIFGMSHARHTFAKARDIVLPIVVFFSFCTFMVHHVSSDVLGIVVVFYALLHPVVFVRVLIAVYTDSATVAKHPERHLFATLRELDVVPQGIDVFLCELAAMRPLDAQLDTLRLAWSKNEEWLRAKWHLCTNDEYSQFGHEVCDMAFPTGTPEKDIHPEQVRISLCVRIASAYQASLASPAVQKALRKRFLDIATKRAKDATKDKGKQGLTDHMDSYSAHSPDDGDIDTEHINMTPLRAVVQAYDSETDSNSDSDTGVALDGSTSSSSSADEVVYGQLSDFADVAAS